MLAGFCCVELTMVIFTSHATTIVSQSFLHRLRAIVSANFTADTNFISQLHHLLASPSSVFTIICLHKKFKMKSTRPNSKKYLSLILMAATASHLTCGFVLPYNNAAKFPTISRFMAAMSNDEIKQQLQEYLEKRKEMNADELAQQEKGKIVGGTKGNKVLEYISGAPVKEQVLNRVPNVFDYDQLTKYGYSNLVTPIMELGGRRAIYELMDVPMPILPGPPPKKTAPKLVIDREGKEDKARYSGLKMGQVLDDDLMAEALANANKKAKEGKEMRQKLMEEEYVRPFSDKRNTGPLQTPDWTVEKLDEYTKQQGKAISWAKRAKEGEFVKDPNEVLDLSFSTSLYCITTWFLVAFAFGRSTPAFLDLVGLESYSGIPEGLQGPGLVLALASVGSAIVNSVILAPQQNRDGFIWSVKGLCGGPLATLELRDLKPLITRGESEAQKTKSS